MISYKEDKAVNMYSVSNQILKKDKKKKEGGGVSLIEYYKEANKQTFIIKINALQSVTCVF